ncbi:unnamed protein product [Brugia timori]|uniref:Ovule protein n=1 Tax=Brugia timori TaxID=42155 RepID=A0A0R3Q7K7_9BILA|nr:unnamed protein product [Brugia timori]
MLKHSETTIFANVYSKSYYVLTVMKASEVYNLVARCHRSKVAIASSHGPCFVLKHTGFGEILNFFTKMNTSFAGK